MKQKLHYQDQDDEVHPLRWYNKVLTWTIISIVTLALLVTFGIVLSSELQRSVVNPQLRANQVQDPQTTIANRQYFHTLLGDVLTDDQNILTQEQAMQQTGCTGAALQTGTCSSMETDLVSLEQIRAHDLGSYNAASDNPDLGKDRDTCLPHTISATEDITTQESELQKIQAQCPAPTNQNY